MPEMTFEWALRQNGIDPNKDLTIDTSVAFAAMEGAFIGGNGDFVTLFEPNATSVEKNGFGYVVDECIYFFANSYLVSRKYDLFICYSSCTLVFLLFN